MYVHTNCPGMYVEHDQRLCGTSRCMLLPRSHNRGSMLWHLQQSFAGLKYILHVPHKKIPCVCEVISGLYRASKKPVTNELYCSS